MSAAVSKRVAHSQRWACAVCKQLLPSAYQIDHVVALADGGADAEHNLQALCANCHADKTQREHVERLQTHRSSEKAKAYDDRGDWYRDGKAVCEVCKLSRPLGRSHPVCWGIEQKFNNYSSGVAVSLERFRFAQRGTAGRGPPTAAGRAATHAAQTKYELPAATTGDAGSHTKQCERSMAEGQAAGVIYGGTSHDRQHGSNTHRGPV